MEHFVPCQDLWNNLFYDIIMIEIKFSERIKSLRIENDISREQLAKHLNVSVRTISYWENAQRECTFEMLIALAEYFDCSVDYLLGKADY